MMIEAKEDECGDARTRYAIAGLSIRGIYAFVLPILGRASAFGDNDFRSIASLVAIVDPDVARVNGFFKELGVQCPVYAPEEFDRMITEQQPDRVIVSGPDFTHHGYIVRALELGRDVIVEKPMVISGAQAQSVLEAEARTGRRVITAHNYRYMPLMQTLKRILQSGRIGRVTNIEFTYNLDTFHGSSYFFRWNRERAKSGGLNIHKCCHHFDLVNWLIDDQPEFVSAFGRRNYYGPTGAHRPKREDGGELSPAETKAACPYFARNYAGKYQPESTDIGTGWDVHRLCYDYQYPPDQARYIYDDAVDIEDTYGAIMEYRGGAILTYSCNFSTPWEGFVFGINGTSGRIELAHRSDPDPTGKLVSAPESPEIVILPLFGGREVVRVEAASGGHGGADPLMQRDLFVGASAESIDLGLMATSLQGATAVCQGEAVYRSLSSKQMIRIADLLGEFYPG